MKPELLAPVQDFTSLKAAIDAGADAVYFGIKELNMRLGANNFTKGQIKKVIDICHKNKVNAYFTLNSIIYENETRRINHLLAILKKNKIDAIIAWDFSVISECKKLSLPVHLSTQASIASFQAAKAIKKQFSNIKRINLARELSLSQVRSIIKQIKQHHLDIEIECFIHGAMCVSISGRCFLSQDIFNKSANRGECLQPCRRKYIIKDIEEDHEFELGSDYIISPKDLCTINIIDKLIKTNISALKIEGRNRAPEYVKTAVECYRKAIDAAINGKLTQSIKDELEKKLSTVYNRGFSTGFYLGQPANGWSKAYGSKATTKKILIGFVKNYYKKIGVAEVKIESGNLKLGDSIMFQGPTTGVVEQKITSMEDSKGKTNKAAKGQLVTIKSDHLVRENDKLFLIRPCLS
ncbi:MAG TPA: U32 family peptidase [Candidatus Nanoarchaeia archaeon]|nr:U32 family peptidase [Candidatus Nanoarchaeia archaeon]